MAEIKEITCIGCPIGCMLEVTMEYNEVAEVKGHTCLKGKAYAIKECTNPTRIVTSTVKVRNSVIKTLSVKTESDIPKDKIKECIAQLRGLEVDAPVHINDVIATGIAGTSVNMVATRDAPEKKE